MIRKWRLLMHLYLYFCFIHSMLESCTSALGMPVHLRHNDLPHLRFAAVHSCRNKADSVFQLCRPSEAIRTVQQLY